MCGRDGIHKEKEYKILVHSIGGYKYTINKYLSRNTFELNWFFIAPDVGIQSKLAALKRRVVDLPGRCHKHKSSKERFQ